MMTISHGHPGPSSPILAARWAFARRVSVRASWSSPASQFENRSVCPIHFEARREPWFRRVLSLWPACRLRLIGVGSWLFGFESHTCRAGDSRRWSFDPGRDVLRSVIEVGMDVDTLARPALRRRSARAARSHRRCAHQHGGASGRRGVGRGDRPSGRGSRLRSRDDDPVDRGSSSDCTGGARRGDVRGLVPSGRAGRGGGCRGWYAAERVELGDAFVADLEVTVSRIAGSPLVFAERWPGVRQAQLRRFPYLLVFRLRDDRVVVDAVAHGHRAPRYWRGR
jgi:toxin ParE1/3/4